MSTFSKVLLRVTNSLNVILMVLPLKLLQPFWGTSFAMVGGTTSFGPPVGMTILAQLVRSTVVSNKIRRMVFLRITIKGCYSYLFFGIFSFCPTFKAFGFDKWLKLTILATVVLCFLAIRARYSPFCTVWMM